MDNIWKILNKVYNNGALNTKVTNSTELLNAVLSDDEAALKINLDGYTGSLWKEGTGIDSLQENNDYSFATGDNSIATGGSADILDLYTYVEIDIPLDTRIATVYTGKLGFVSQEITLQPNDILYIGMATGDGSNINVYDSYVGIYDVTTTPLSQEIIENEDYLDLIDTDWLDPFTGVYWSDSGGYENTTGAVQKIQLNYTNIWDFYDEDDLGMIGVPIRMYLSLTTEAEAVNLPNVDVSYPNLNIDVNIATAAKNAVAIGKSSLALGEGSVAIRGTASGEGSVAFDGGVASGNGAFAFGKSAKAYGEGSIASTTSLASAFHSVAFGTDCEATAPWAFALGNDCEATDHYAFATGWRCKATNENAVAMGVASIAGGKHSFAIGFWNVASGDHSVAVNRQNSASGIYSFASGYKTEATASSSASFGDNTRANGVSSIACGTASIADGDYSFAGGESSNAANRSSFAFGYQCTANKFAIAAGKISFANGEGAVALGHTPIANGNGAVALGYVVSATAGFALATGYHTTASATGSSTFGSHTNSSVSNKCSIGSYNIDTSDSIFEIGIGVSDSLRTNALQVNKNTGDLTLFSDLIFDTADSKIQIKSANGTAFNISVDNTGNIISTAVV